jgi:hypothetical protein
MDSNQYDRLLDSLEVLKKDLEDVKEIVIKNTVVLDEHARRSTASEARLEVIEANYVQLNVESLAKAQMLTWALGILGALGTIFGIVDVIHNFL